jgi:hypothetical protein
VVKVCPTCGAKFVPNRPEQRFCRRNCGRWKNHTAITDRLSRRGPRDPWEGHLAGLIATDGCVEYRKGRDAPTQISVKMAAAACPMLEQIARHFGRRVYARANGQFVLTFNDIPVLWKREVPQLDPGLTVHYIRGLLDGDGCVSGARVESRTYPYISLSFNPRQEPWVGEFYCQFLDDNAIEWKRQDDRPTVAQIRSWSRQALKLASLVYDGTQPAHPEKLQRARLIVSCCSRRDRRVEWPRSLFEMRPYGAAEPKSLVLG